MHGYFVICSAEGLTSGDCVATFTEFPGFGTLPLAKSVNGEAMRMTMMPQIEKTKSSV